MLSLKCSKNVFQNSFGLRKGKTSILVYLIRRGIKITLNNMNHYKSLGLENNATQNDIKTAYYKLSMLYHPDKNKGSDSAAKKFREITSAYEVLGNLRLRRLYDKGIIHTAGAQYAQSEPDYVHEEPVDDAQTKFYKAREKRSQVPHSTGRTPIYNFDEWSRAHYGASFERKQQAKQRKEMRDFQKKNLKLSGETEILFGFILAVIIAINICLVKDYDKDKIKKTDKTKNDG